MRFNLRHLGILSLILAAAIGFGFAFEGIATAIEKRKYPRPDELAAGVTQNANLYGVPEAVLWAVIKTESDFASNKRGEDGSIGLMQLTPDEFDMIRTELMELEPLDAGMLYDPDTNLQCGAAYLSHLYRRYGVWRTVFAAYAVGEARVDAWLKSKDHTDELGNLSKIPDAAVDDFVKAAVRAMEAYTKLYY